MRVPLIITIVVVLAAGVGAFLYFGQDDDAELDAAAGAECHTHAMARALGSGRTARDWRVNSVTRGHVDPVAKTGQLYVVSGTLSVKDRYGSGVTTNENVVCRLERTEQGDWQLLEMSYSPPER